MTVTTKIENPVLTAGVFNASLVISPQNNSRDLLSSGRWDHFKKVEARFIPRRKKLGSFCNPCLAVIYLSPWLLCRFDLAARAISISRRIASERDGLSFCSLAQFSTAILVADGSRKVKTGSWPVAGRPLFLCIT
jgi:hypothetical protein